jgi:SPP1 family predicted phage head-tail adaptor
MSDAIGALKARVTLQSQVRVADEIGGAAIAWSDQGDVWAEIVCFGAGESAAFDAAASISAYRLTINRRDVRSGWRVAWGERLLRITGVRDEGAARIELSCKEEML